MPGRAESACETAVSYGGVGGAAGATEGEVFSLSL
eukprot:COSAG03_NODE_16503_length_399_cov_865.236667_1_plen_34_part_10